MATLSKELYHVSKKFLTLLLDGVAISFCHQQMQPYFILCLSLIINAIYLLIYRKNVIAMQKHGLPVIYMWLHGQAECHLNRLMGFNIKDNAANQELRSC
jgi:hypothetical protein